MPVNWNALVKEHGRMIFQTAMRVLDNAADAEEVVQEVFLKVISGNQIDRIRNWGAYFRRLAIYAALDRRRRFRQEHPHSLESLATWNSSPFDDAVRRELAEHLRSVIAALPEREGAVFALRYFDQLSNSEIATVLEISTGAVAAAIHKVRVKLDVVLSNSSKGESQ